ncbi:hypothetical protein GF327_09155 [Candidatus Woesearchaeota archaeon]|nr:hypothetical protein [Candidatus Woesearchaeota archaeon]
MKKIVLKSEKMFDNPLFVITSNMVLGEKYTHFLTKHKFHFNISKNIYPDLFLDALFRSDLADIFYMQKTSLPDILPLRGACTPGKVRLFVTKNGKMLRTRLILISCQKNPNLNPAIAPAGRILTSQLYRTHLKRTKSYSSNSGRDRI